MPAKLTTTQFVEKAKVIHGDKYDYSDTEYLGNSKKVAVVCRVHGAFYPLANDHLSKKAGCPACAGVKRLNQQDFIARSKSVHGNVYDYSETVYKNFNSPLTLTCDQGHRFNQLASSHLNGFGCPHCAGLARKTTEQFVTEAKAKFGGKFDYSKVEYVNTRTPVVIVCPIKGEFKMQPIQHLSSNTGYTSEIYNAPSTLDEFVCKAKEVHGDRYDYSKSAYQSNKNPVEIVCKEHGSFWQAPHNHYKGSGCPTCALGRTESKPERILVEALADFHPIKTKGILEGRELDLYFENQKVAVEVNGIYYHSDIKAKAKTAHRRKYEECKKLGIKLMQFTDAEILKKPEIVVGMIRNALGVSQKLNARSCEVREVCHADQITFFKGNHISGGVSAKISFGLYLNNELMSCMSFNKPRFTDNAEWEIIRFATKVGYVVRGGASKLFKAFADKTHPTSILSYADLRFGAGSVYERLGFSHSHDSEAGYSYHHQNGTVITRYQAQKHKLSKLLEDKFDQAKSERDNMISAGYHKIYDCGHKVWVWVTTP